MKRGTMNDIQSFLNSGPVAVAGVSRDKKKFGRMVFDELRAKGYSLVPINPNIESIDEAPCYPDVAGLPEDVRNLLIITPKEYTSALIQQAIVRGMERVWIQQASDTPEALRLADEAGLKLIAGRCIYMFAKPSGIHRFHYRLTKLFGGIPKV